MSQLENFREQLKRRSQPVEETAPVQDERSGIVETDSPAPRKMRKKKDDRTERACVWLPKDEWRKIKLVSLWIDSEGIDGPKTAGDLLVEAVECLIETRYPKAKAFLKRMA